MTDDLVNRLVAAIGMLADRPNGTGLIAGLALTAGITSPCPSAA